MAPSAPAPSSRTQTAPSSGSRKTVRCSTRLGRRPILLSPHLRQRRKPLGRYQKRHCGSELSRYLCPLQPVCRAARRCRPHALGRRALGHGDRRGRRQPPAGAGGNGAAGDERRRAGRPLGAGQLQRPRRRQRRGLARRGCRQRPARRPAAQRRGAAGEPGLQHHCGAVRRDADRAGRHRARDLGHRLGRHLLERARSLHVLVAAAPPDAALVASLGSAVEPLIGAPEPVEATRIGGIGVVDGAVLEDEGAHARPIAREAGRIGSAGGREAGDGLGDRCRIHRVAAAPVIVFDAAGALLRLGEVEIEVAPRRGRPGKAPAHPPLIGLQLRERGARDGPEHHIVVRQVNREAVEAVRNHRAGGAARRPVGSEHEMVDEELRAPAEEVGERGAPAIGLEAVLLLDLDPGQLLPPPRQLVAAPRQLLLRLQQIEPRRQPFLACPGGVCRHRFRSRGSREIGKRRAAASRSDKCGGIPMDSLITAAARALASGDPLGALNRVALRDDAPALALRGVAMAQLGDFPRARALLRRAARAFGPKAAVSRARCLVAEAEIALAARDLAWPARALDAARAVLEEHGDRVNAAHARHLELRRLLLIGRLDEVERCLAALDPAALRPALRAAHELVVAGLAMRRLRTKAALAALAEAERAARDAGIPALTAEVESAALLLRTSAARLIARGAERPLLLEEVEAVLASGVLVVDACRHAVRDGDRVVPLARRPVLFALARALGEAWPGDMPRDALVARVFRAKRADDSHRARLRVEIGRLRAALRGVADLTATKRGFALAPRRAGEVVVLARPVEERHAAVLAFLADGEAWSSSALALALGSSTRTVQRALNELAASGKVQPVGRGRARRWLTPPGPGLTMSLLLPPPLPSG